MEILSPIIVLGSLGLVFGIWLTFAHKMFAVKPDARVEHIFSLLPGSNCGACGKAGCYNLAEALAKDDAERIVCPVASEENWSNVAEYLGIASGKKAKQVATLICGGGKKCKDKFQYHGPRDCNAAFIVMNGPKACVFGCIGFGSCVRVCPFGAMSMGEYGLPKIDMEKCTACGKCIKVCPVAVLALTPAASQYHIKCSSKDRGADVMKACKAGCIACGKCVKACPVSAITIKDNLARIDYTICKNHGECIKVCPTKAIGRRE